VIRIVVGPLEFRARLEEAAAPRSCAAFRKLLPWAQELIHGRWSGEAGWIPLGDLAFGVGVENATSAPAPGELLLYPGGISETEVLFPYGISRFACKDGPLEGNRFLTVVEGRERLPELGRLLLRKGAQPIRFEEV
jgi:hypothetical protein